MSAHDVLPTDSSTTTLLPAEDLTLTNEQQAVYDAATRALYETPTTHFWALIPSIVSMDLPTTTRSTLVETSLLRDDTDTSSSGGAAGLFDLVPTIATAGDAAPPMPPMVLPTFTVADIGGAVSVGRVSSGHHALYRAIEALDGLEKQEQTLAVITPVTRQLTEMVLNAGAYENSQQAIAALEALGQAVPRRVCQHPFKKNDIVWVCRTCQADETCVLCHACYSQSSHEGHDVAFYHAQAGGCCDCGDPDAWNPAGFCPRHGPEAAASSESLAAMVTGLAPRVRGVVPACVDWLVQTVAANAERGYARANPPAAVRRKGSRPPVTEATVPPGGPSTAAAAEPMSTVVVESPVYQNPWIPSRQTLPEVLIDAMQLVQDDEDNDMEDDDEEDEVETLDDSFPVNHPQYRPQVFSPTAASIPSSLTQEQVQQAERQAEVLGIAGRDGHGLYIVLYADDIHTNQQLLEALKDFLGTTNYFTDTLLGKLVRALRQFGQLVIWGTTELIQEYGSNTVHLWMDGDKVATARIGSLVKDRVRRLTKRGMFCSILTRDELVVEQLAVAVTQWLSALARSCDPLCMTVAECILPNRHLVPLLRADFKMSARVTKAWYSLLLTLLAVPAFKSHLAAAYCDTYRAVTAKYARGMGVLERSGYTLSVQFLNRVTYVIDLVQGRDLLGKLGKSLLETLLVASRSPRRNGRLDPNHFVLTHRRYSPCISDFKCVLNVSGMPRVIAARRGSFLKDWVSALSRAQFMDVQQWRHWAQAHVEDESRGWVGAFNASISLGSLFERLLGWADEEISPIAEGPLSGDLMSCVELTLHILTNGLAQWQEFEKNSYLSISSKYAMRTSSVASAILPFSTIASMHGSGLAMRQMPVSQDSPFSFHLPLHRFVAGCLRELCLRKNCAVGGIGDLLEQLRMNLSEKQNDSLFQGLMEFPVLVLSRAAQIRAGLWRRNGSGLNDQVLNYAEPPFCRNMRDADLLLAQFAAIGRIRNQSPEPRPLTDVGVAFLFNVMLHRLGIFEFVGLTNSVSDSNGSQYVHEAAMGLYGDERTQHSVDLDRFIAIYSPSRDSSTSMLLLEEFLHFVIVFVVELPPGIPQTKEEQTQQAKLRLFQEVIHRLASGPKTHSELSEVHHVLSHWDNVLLSEEGKLVNPDDATGAALASVLMEVADRKISRGKMEPDKWEMRQAAWDSYDPAFFHISLRSHQTAAAEGRPKPSEDTMAPFGWEAKPYAPAPVAAHPFFERIRRDTTSDAVVMSIAYRVLHLHLREKSDKSLLDLQGKAPYESNEKSETALARTIHLYTLGAYAWRNASSCHNNWRECGGGSIGSVFFRRDDSPPTVKCWVKEVLLVEPRVLLGCEWYSGEENALVLLKRLAVNDGKTGGFVAQDSAVRSGAAWLCEFALACCPEASGVISPISVAGAISVSPSKTEESEIEKRKKMAKAKALANMKAQAAKFAAMMDVDIGSEDESLPPTNQETFSICSPSTPNRPIRKSSFGSIHSSASSYAAGDSDFLPDFVAIGGHMMEDSSIPPRLLRNRPRCIICNDEDGVESRLFEKIDHDEGEGQRKKSKRRTENALGFVGYAQASTVLKGGGGPPPDLDSKFSTVCEFVGTHVALCGHAVHSECCESYLATVSNREDRQIGKRDEFRCPLCQRLSNCLIPFIDVGLDWIDSPDIVPTESLCENIRDSGEVLTITPTVASVSLHDFLESTPWWLSRRRSSLTWDGQCAFVDCTAPPCDEGFIARKPSRIRSLKKKDLYAAWNAMMHTPRLVRRKLRRSSSRASASDKDPATISLSTGEDSVGETVVWRRFMDQISEISFKADSKRLGDDHLHDLFGEFRHYVVEKHAYSMANVSGGNDPADWPACLFTDVLSENRKQEMSREKLLSKLLLSIQAFTYSCCCEAFEARRSYRKCTSSLNEIGRKSQESSLEAVLSKFGISGVACDGRMTVMPIPSAQEEGGAWPFDGRLGKLRYFALTVMAASGAVAADLVHLVLAFPLHSVGARTEIENPQRAPIAYPVLFGNILTHIVAAMCSACGRARARSDSLDVSWSIPFSPRGSFVFADESKNGHSVDSVGKDCEGFIKLGMLARILQVLLGCLEIPPRCTSDLKFWALTLMQLTINADGIPPVELGWMKACIQILGLAFSTQRTEVLASSTSNLSMPSLYQLHEACLLAASAASSFLMDAGTILQILIPGSVTKYDAESSSTCPVDASVPSPVSTLDAAIRYLKLEPIHQVLESSLVQAVLANWFDCARSHEHAAIGVDEASTALRSRLYRTQGYRIFDWPSAGALECLDTYRDVGDGKDGKQRSTERQPQDDCLLMPHADLPIESILSLSQPEGTADVLRSQPSPTLLTYSTRKSVSLLGGYSSEIWDAKRFFGSGNATVNSINRPRPRVLTIPTSYTDLYAELASLMPDCEQTAVCLICGEVLNAGGRSECTRHSYKCGAGAGLFFLLQECSGLILHKSKAAYIHSPYVDSHGETPQYRGRPLNLDLDRYEHWREVWFSHGVRQKVVAERGISRQVILPDYY